MKRYSLLSLFLLTLLLSQKTFAATTFTVDAYPTLTFTTLTDTTVSVVGSAATTGVVTIPSSVTDPNTDKQYTVTTIKTSAFRENENITGIKLNEGLQTIGASAFYKCTNLGGEINIPSTVTQIGNYAFYVCGAITKITFNEGDANLSIGLSAFNTPTANDSIGDLVLPAHINYIGRNAFYKQNFPSITIESLAPPTLDFDENAGAGSCRAFSGSTCNICIPCGTYYEYMQDTVWNIAYKSRLNDGIAKQSHTLENGIILEILSDSTAQVIGHTEEISGMVEIPSSVNLQSAINTCTHEYAIISVKTSAFRETTSITGIKLNEGLQTIGASAFYKCTNLGGEINIPSTVTQIGNYAFYVCGAITKITFNEGDANLSIGLSAFNTPTANDSIGDLVLPAHISYIGRNAFYKQNFPSITLESLTPPTLDFDENTGAKSCGAFSGSTCNIYIPCGMYYEYMQDTVWNIAYKSRLNDGIAKQSHTLENGIILEILSDSTAQVIGHTEEISGMVEIPSSVNLQSAINTCTHEYAIVSVKTSALRETESITGIKLNEGLQTIGASAFYKCTNLGGEVNIPSTVTQIGNYAFASCGKFTNISFNEGISGLSIGLAAFSSAERNEIINELIIPASVTFIDENAFSQLIFPAIRIETDTPMEIAGQIFNGSTCPIYIPCGTYAIYTQHSIWNTYYRNRLNDGLPLNTTHVADNLKVKIITDSTVQVIGYDNIEDGKLIIPSFVTISEETCSKVFAVVSIAGGAFRDSVNICNLTLSEGLRYIGGSAFARCANLVCDLEIPSSVDSIGDYAFFNCKSFSSLKLQEGVRTVGKYSFYSEIQQDTFLLPSTMQTIGDRAFAKLQANYIIVYPVIPPVASETGAEIFSNTTQTIVIPCGAMENYKNANYWKDLSTKFVSACKPLKLEKGEALTKDTIVSSIAFSRTFPMNLWQELYLPFEMDSMLVDDDGYWDVYFPFNSDKASDGGYFYLYGLKEINMTTGTITFQEVHELNANTPYLILFIDKHTDYFKNKDIIFKSKQGEYKLTDNYTAPTLNSEYQLHGNQSLWEHSLANGFTLSPSYSYENGNYNYNFHFDYQETAELPPFSWVVTPTKAIQASPSLAPRLLSGRWGNQSSSGGDTPTSMQTVSGGAVTYTQAGSQLTLYTQGQPCKVYAVDGTLLLSTDGAQEEVSIELNKGLYIIYSNGQSQKVLF